MKNLNESKLIYGLFNNKTHDTFIGAEYNGDIIDSTIVERAKSIIFKSEDDRLIILKHRGDINGDFHLENYTVKSINELRTLKWNDELQNAEILITDTPYTPYECQSKILQENEVRYFIEMMKRPKRLTSYDMYRQNYMSIKEIDELCKVFDPIYDKQIIEYFPNELMDRFKVFNKGKSINIGLVADLRWAYMTKAGFSIITKPLADSLADYLKGKKCLEIMAGNGVLSKALQDRDIDIIATDNKSWYESSAYEDVWTEVENLEAGDAIRKYKNVDYILVSWMPIDVPSKRIVRMIRKYNPNVKIIVIGEEQGGCTSNDAWFDRVKDCFDIDFSDCGVNSHMVSWNGVHDDIDIYKVTKPWIPKIVDRISNDN